MAVLFYGGKPYTGLTAQYVSNPNLIINPDFKINQRGNTSWSTSSQQGAIIAASQIYTVDRWRIMSGSASIVDGVFTLNGTIQQVIEADVGDVFTASMYIVSGTAAISYDSDTKKVTVTGENAVIKWVKLEASGIATAFTPPDPATEMLKCQRYYQSLTSIPLMGVATTTSVIRVALSTYCQMRTLQKASLECSNSAGTWSMTIVPTDGSENIAVASAPTIAAIHRVGSELNASITIPDAPLTAWRSYILTWVGDTKFILDAEIY
ncbi:MAG: hypothetical protein IJ368_00385 [Oscillospiraceae bacterium]|nr:hypothetical protein [Oscillospiraceae bacterium]